MYEKAKARLVTALLLSLVFISLSGTFVYRHLPLVAGVNAAPPAAAVRDARVISVVIPDSVQPGQPFQVKVTVQNTGSQTWMRATNYKLGTQGVSGSVWPPYRAELSNSVSNGQQITFDFTLTAPSASGSYQFDWQMLQESVAWFGDHAVGTVNVAGATPAPPSVPPSAPVSELLVMPASRGDPLDLSGAKIVDTGGVLMDGQQHRIRKRWNGTQKIKIVGIEVWIGALYNNIADMNVGVFRIRSDGSEDLMAEVGWDHYANPTVPILQAFMFSPNYFSIGGGESVEVRYLFNPLGDPSQVRMGHTTVKLLVTY